MKRSAVVLVGLTACIVGFWLWWHYRVPPDVVPQGDQSERLALIGLWVAIIGLLTNLVILLTRIVEMVKAGR